MYRDLYNRFHTQLEHIDLADKEVKTYLALVANGALTAEQIAKTTGLNRSTVYVQIEELSEMGLVSAVKDGKKTLFTAESPENLEDIIERRAQRIRQQKVEVESMVPELMQTFAKRGARPGIRMFQGKSGLAALRNEILEHTDAQIKVLTNADLFYQVADPKDLESYDKKRKSKQIKSKVIYVKQEGEDFIPYDDQEIRRADISQYDFATEMYISERAVAMASISDNIFGTLIVNENIAMTMDTMFESLWRNIDKPTE